MIIIHELPFLTLLVRKINLPNRIFALSSRILMNKKLILITNDDGILAPGLKALVNIAKKHGEVVVVAPNSPQSGMGHAITINHPLRLHKIEAFEGIEAYECTGTPVDCVLTTAPMLLSILFTQELCQPQWKHPWNRFLLLDFH